MVELLSRAFGVQMKGLSKSSQNPECIAFLPEKFWSILIVASLAFFPLGMLGLAQLDEEYGLFIPTQLIRDGLLPFRDYPAPVWQLNMFTLAGLCSLFPWVHTHLVSLVWTFISYFTVALVGLYFCRYVMAKFGKGEPSRPVVLLYIALYFLFGPVFDPYHKYITDAIRWGSCGLLLLSLSLLEERYTRRGKMCLLLGSICCGLSGAAVQHIGMSAICLGTGFVVLRWILRKDGFWAGLAIPLFLLILPLSIEVAFFYQKGVAAEFYYWTIVMPSKVRTGTLIFTLKRLVGFGHSDIYPFFPFLMMVALDCGFTTESRGAHPFSQWVSRKAIALALGMSFFWIFLFLVSWQVRQPMLPVLTWVWCLARKKCTDHTADVSRLATCCIWLMAFALLGMTLYILGPYTPAWLITLHAKYPELQSKVCTQFAFFSLEIVIGAFLFLLCHAIGVLSVRDGWRAALRLCSGPLALMALYAAALVAGLSIGRRCETAMPLSLIALGIYGLSFAGILPTARFTKVSRRMAFGALILLLIVMNLRRDSGLADPLYRPVAFAAPFQSFIDRELLVELEKVRKFVDEPQHSLFVYQADGGFYTFYGKLPPSKSIYFDGHCGTRVTPGWDAAEVARLSEGNVTTVITLAKYKREDSFLFQLHDPIRDWIEAQFNPVHTGNYMVVWRRK